MISGQILLELEPEAPGVIVHFIQLYPYKPETRL
jgi:hypothetical protein